MKCPICGQDHAADVSCSTLVRRGSGTAEMLPWTESSLTESGTVGADVGPPGAVDPILGMQFGSFRVVKMMNILKMMF